MLSQARKSGVFTAVHDAFWFEARKTDGDAGGTRALIEVLLLHRSMDAEDVIAGIALQVGAVTADASWPLKPDAPVLRETVPGGAGTMPKHARLTETQTGPVN